MKPSKRQLWFLILFTFHLVELAMAYRGSNNIESSVHRQMMSGYYQVSAVLTVGVLYLQLRRVGLKQSTFYLVALIISVYLLNDVWRIFIGGGSQTVFQLVLLIGTLLAYQIIAAVRTLNRRKAEKFQID
jgi:hypothetical protein